MQVETLCLPLVCGSRSSGQAFRKYRVKVEKAGCALAQEATPPVHGESHVVAIGRFTFESATTVPNVQVVEAGGGGWGQVETESDDSLHRAECL